MATQEKDIHSAYSDGKYTGLPDTSGPVSVRIEVDTRSMLAGLLLCPGCPI